jgi:hypothetical protein
MQRRLPLYLKPLLLKATVWCRRSRTAGTIVTTDIIADITIAGITTITPITTGIITGVAIGIGAITTAIGIATGAIGTDKCHGWDRGVSAFRGTPFSVLRIWPETRLALSVPSL